MSGAFAILFEAKTRKSTRSSVEGILVEQKECYCLFVYHML